MIDPAQSLRGATVAPNSDKPGASSTVDYADGLHMFDFRRYWHSFLERIWIVAICVLAGLFLALGNLARTPKLYQAHTVLEAEFQEPSFVPTNDSTTRTRSVFLASQEALRTIEQLYTNQTLLARVVSSEGLAQDGGRALLGQRSFPTRIPARQNAPNRRRPPTGCRTPVASRHLRRSKKRWVEEWPVWCIR